MTDVETLSDTEKNTRARKQFLAWILGFFGLFIVVDITFWVLADNSHTGVVTEGAYDQGISYNETIEAAEGQAALGWRSEITLDESVLNFTLADKHDNALDGADVTAKFTRPSHEGYDFTVTLTENDRGNYSAVVDLPLEGQWDVRVFATWNQQTYQQSKRVMAKP